MKNEDIPEYAPTNEYYAPLQDYAPKKVTEHFEAPDKNYIELVKVFSMAYHQAANGKGLERHASGERFEDQLICDIARRLGSVDGQATQVIKKTYEAVRMSKQGKHNAAISDILGAINYAAAMVIMLQEKEEQK